MTPNSPTQHGFSSPTSADAGRTDLYGRLAAWVARLRGALGSLDEFLPSEALAVRARLTPLDAQGRPRESREVRLYDFDERGVSFEHPAPLADRRAVMSLEAPAWGVVSAEVDLSWRRYLEGGRYVSGGRLLIAEPASE